MTPRTHPARARAAFTLTELLITIAIIIVLVGLLLAAMGGVWSGGQMTKSMSNMRQIATWMQQYSSENADHIVPSRFDYGSGGYAGKVRSAAGGDPPQGAVSTGTWTDILHAVFEVKSYPLVPGGYDYRFDSPDKKLYDDIGEGAVRNPFRSAAKNSRSAPGFGSTEPPTPFGGGAQEIGYPGFFAANDFFRAGWPGDPPDASNWYTNGQIRFPAQSMYLVDSFYGETILPEPGPFDTSDPPDDIQVDFRYAGDICLMLFLDGHVGTVSLWQDLAELEGDPADPADNGRGIRVTGLTSR